MQHPTPIRLLAVLLAGSLCPALQAKDPEQRQESAAPPVEEPPAHFQDCNGNGIDDSVDIALGNSCDENRNAVPDECETAEAEDRHDLGR